MLSWLIGIAVGLPVCFAVLIGICFVCTAVLLTLVGVYWVGIGIGKIVVVVINFILSIGGNLNECFRKNT